MCPLLFNQAGQEYWVPGRLQVLQVALQEEQEQEQEQEQEGEGQLQVVVELAPQVETQQLQPLSLDQALDRLHTAPL